MRTRPRRRKWKYDVFISFRGEDTRNNFTGNLYSNLGQRGILTFMDDKELRKGDSLDELFTAIEESRSAIMVLSQNFVSSSWCLDEVVKIMQCRKERGQIVTPVFYQVDPSDVRHQRGSFQLRNKVQVEVMDHEDVYGANEEKLKEWGAALTQLANISGWDSRQYRSEVDLIEGIVRDIFDKANHAMFSSSADKGFRGMESRIADLLHNYIRPQSGGVRIIGIHGMRGIGKTTLALAIHDEICQDYDGRCFLSNVRERSIKDGLVSLQEQLLLTILGKKIDLSNVYAGATMIKRRLCKRKVLVVIDDADHISHLEQLAGSRDWFGPGSRILVTTTDIHLLQAHRVDATYKAAGLEGAEATELLSLKAFKTASPPDDYVELCRLILQYAQGLPLALVVLGSYLCGRSTDEWESALERLKASPHKGIIDVLKISYDGLEGEKDKEIFLHIACFYKGKDRDRVIQILDYCDLNPVIGLSVLAERSLITISDSEVSVHDLLQEMGKEIVRLQSPTKPGKRSRLWSHIDIHHVLKKNKNFDNLKFIKLRHSQKLIQSPDPTGVQNLETLDLEGCNSLVELHQSFGQLKKLTVLNLKDCKSLESLPSRIDMDSLRTFILSNCSKVKQIPEFVENMERLSELYLDGTAIYTLPISVGCLSGLTSLNLSNCRDLVCLPSTISRLKSLEKLNLSGCLKLGDQASARESGVIRTSVNHVIKRGCEVVGKYITWSLPFRLVKEVDIEPMSAELPESDLCYSTDQNTTTLTSIQLPLSGIWNLTDLNLSGCNLGDVAFANLVALNLSGNNIFKLPPSIRSCFNLQNINLENCKKLQELSDLPSNSKLDVRANGCSALEMLFDLSNFNRLEKSYFIHQLLQTK